MYQAVALVRTTKLVQPEVLSEAFGHERSPEAFDGAVQVPRLLKHTHCTNTSPIYWLPDWITQQIRSLHGIELNLHFLSPVLRVRSRQGFIMVFLFWIVEDVFHACCICHVSQSIAYSGSRQ